MEALAERITQLKMKLIAGPFSLSDVSAGLIVAVVTIPDALASGVLAGVGPVHGLYGVMAGTLIAAVLVGSELLSVTNTSAMAIAIGSTLAGYTGEALIQALVTIALVTGVVQVAAAVLRLSYLVRFASNAVIAGFITGIALIIVISQLEILTGYEYTIDYSHKFQRTLDLLIHIGQVDVPTTIVGLTAIILALALHRTRFCKVSMLLALIAASSLVYLFHLDSVVLVGDTSDISSIVPSPALPIPVFDPNLIIGGVAVAIIGLVQGAGISSVYKNKSGNQPDFSRDFLAQGAANFMVSIFQGLPVGGSVASTALLISAGGKSRWANILAGVFIIVSVLLAGHLVEKIPLTVLAAMLVVAGLLALDVGLIYAIWLTNMTARFVMILAFIVTMVFPIWIAVFLCVGINILLHFFGIKDRA
jgi:SulP family sulfate permease